MPTTYGDATVALEEVDYLVEVDEPVARPNPGASDDVAAAIGGRVAAQSPTAPPCSSASAPSPTPRSPR